MASFSRRFTLGVFAGALAVSAGLTSAHADQLDDIRKAGVLRVATFDSNPAGGEAFRRSGQPDEPDLGEEGVQALALLRLAGGSAGRQEQSGIDRPRPRRRGRSARH